MTHPDCFKFCFRRQQDCHRPVRSVAPTAASSRAEAASETDTGHQAPDTLVVGQDGGENSATATSHTEHGGTHLIAATGTYPLDDTHNPDFTELHKLHRPGHDRAVAHAPVDCWKPCWLPTNFARYMSKTSNRGVRRKSSCASQPAARRCCQPSGERVPLGRVGCVWEIIREVCASALAHLFFSIESGSLR